MRIGCDRWGFEGLDGKALRDRSLIERDMVVRDLWQPDCYSWDESHVCTLYGDDVRERIISLSIIRNGPPDRMVSLYDVSGCYSTISSYSWLTL